MRVADDGGADNATLERSNRRRDILRHMLMRSILAVAMAAPAVAAMAGARPPTAPSGFASPPTNEQIRDRLRDICSSLLQDEDKLAAPIATRRCGCYADGVTKAMSAPELDEMRVTGKFAPSAQPKAKKFMASCKVKS